MAVSKEAFIDAAAIQIMEGFAAAPITNVTPQEIAKQAYNWAEALWAERECRRLKAEEEQQNVP